MELQDFIGEMGEAVKDAMIEPLTIKGPMIASFDPRRRSGTTVSSPVERKVISKSQGKLPPADVDEVPHMLELESDTGSQFNALAPRRQGKITLPAPVPLRSYDDTEVYVPKDVGIIRSVRPNTRRNPTARPQEI